MQYQRPVLIQEQRLRMSPQLLQSIQIMTLPIQDLRTRIQEELEKNPALEVLEDPPSLSLEEAARKPAEELEYFENSSDPGFESRGYDDEAGDAKRKFMEGVISRPESLQDHLLWQLNLQPISEELRNLGELLIRNLDENGFHREDPRVLVKPEQRGMVEAVLGLIQAFDPLGVGVANYRESLLLQARLMGNAPAYTEIILEQYLELLEKGKFKEIAKKLKITEEQVQDCLSFIKLLTPFPGRLYSNDSATYVIPDLMVKLKDGQFVIILNDEEIPVLGVNAFFSDIKEASQGLKVGKEKREVRQFVSGRMKEAQWFIQSIHQRNQTLLKVAKAIIEFQRDFFIKGPKMIKPLTLRDIAQEIGVHEATVSRITSSKYMQTEWGIYELKYFFSNSISGTGSGGSNFSKEGVKQVVKEIIAQQNSKGNKQLSDQRIAELLAARGIKIARRTVAKYRHELDIGSSYGR